MLTEVKAYIQRHRLLEPGDLIGAAVSGGTDSVALLLALMELRDELGCVLSVVHFNHKIRGAEADADERFVAELADSLKLEFLTGSGDTPSRAKESRESLETAAHELRYQYFRELVAKNKVNKIALGHTMDDQAETVMMRLVRGAGTRGLAGIYPQRTEEKATFIRPLLGIRRAEVEEFLKAHKQAWREDATNQDVAHTRNKVRHELMSKLREFNPAIVETLSRTADAARAEEDYWRTETERLLPLIIMPGKATRGGGRSVITKESQSFGVDLQAFTKHPLALQRRLIRAAADSLDMELDAEHIAAVLRIATGDAKAVELPEGWRAVRSHRELRFEVSEAAIKTPAVGYDYPAPIPGQVAIPDVNLLVHLHLMPLAKEDAAYNLEALQAPKVFCREAGRLTPLAPAAGLRVRNWRDGDRFRQAHSSGEKKVKDLLQDLKVPKAQRGSWPVVSSGEKVIWVRGTRALPLVFADANGMQKLVIEAQEQK